MKRSEEDIRVAYEIVVEGSRLRGRPKERWRDQLRKDMQELDKIKTWKLENRRHKAGSIGGKWSERQILQLRGNKAAKEKKKEKKKKKKKKHKTKINLVLLKHYVTKT